MTALTPQRFQRLRGERYHWSGSRGQVMDQGLKGKVAVVAAASKGLGKAVAMGLAAEGASIAICSREQAAIDRAADEIRAKTGAAVLPLAVDLTNAEQIQRFVDSAAAEFGRVDIL